MKRTLFESDHDELRESFGRFLDEEIVPHYQQWEEDGLIPREVIRRAGELGFFGMQIPEKYGGAGVVDFRFNAVLVEESYRRGLASFGMYFVAQNDVVLPYLLELTDDAQKERWLPGIVTGEWLLGIAISEPGTGSDMAAVATRAIRDGDIYRIDGTKTFISNGINANLLVTVVRTGDDVGAKGLSLVVVEGDTEGFHRGKRLSKLGLRAQDTAEIFFDGAKVPMANRLGAEGAAFGMLTHNLAQERLSLAVGSVASARGALERTLEYVCERTAFGRPVGTFQNSRFVLASCHAEVEASQALLDRSLDAHTRGELTPEDAALVKLWTSESQGRVVDSCLQLHGGYGYIWDNPIARDYADARISRIFGGTSEIMREIIGRSLGLGDR